MKLLNVTHPSETQKQMLALVISSPTPQLASEYAIANENMATAMKMLIRLGLLEQSEEGLVLTDTGWQVAVEEGLVTEPNGELTQLGQKMANIAAGDSPTQEPEDELDTTGVPNEIQPTNASDTTALS